MFFYLATVYSRHPHGIEAAHREACIQAAYLIRHGVPVYSPIAHTHPIAIHGALDPLDHDIWLPADEPMMRAAVGLIVCKMHGWETSKGVQHEIDVFEKADKPIIFMEPGLVPVCFRDVA